MNTQKLFEIDSHMIEFEATVLSCEKIGKNYAIVLDKTAFFPNGGGQPSDTGYIGDIEVIDSANSRRKIFCIFLLSYPV